MEANLIVIGGPISVGKSSLSKSLPYPQISELDENDDVQKLLLEATYKKDRVDPEVIEHYFLKKRKKIYEKFSKTLQTHVLDRSIFETLWFAKANMSEKSFLHFEKLWKKDIEELICNFGKPKIYILLTFSWETFKDRLFNRAREVEISNFKSNEEFFKKHVAQYEEHMIGVFKMFDLNYYVLNTDNLSFEHVFEKVQNKINDLK